MSQKDKLLKKFLNIPSDFTYNELKLLLTNFGYSEDTKQSGSRVAFVNETNKDIIRIHKPHPGNIVKQYVIKQIIDKLKGANLI